MSSQLDSFTMPIELESLEFNLKENKTFVLEEQFNGFDWEGSSGSHSPDLTFTPSTTESPEDSDNPDKVSLNSFSASDRFLDEDSTFYPMTARIENFLPSFVEPFPTNNFEESSHEFENETKVGTEINLMDGEDPSATAKYLEAALETLQALETLNSTMNPEKTEDEFMESMEVVEEEIYDGEETEDEEINHYGNMVLLEPEILHVDKDSDYLRPVPLEQIYDAPEDDEGEEEEQGWDDEEDGEDEETYYLDPNNQATYIPLPPSLKLPFLPPLPTKSRSHDTYSSPAQSTSKLSFNDEAYQDDEEYRDSSFNYTRSSSYANASNRRKNSYVDSQDSNSLTKRKTETLAVEDDPSVKPYGCSYPSCVVINEERESKGKGRLEDGLEDEEEEEEGGFQNSFRTIRELRDHCALHKKSGERGGETPFRCSLEPCNKTFKSLAGLHTHFLNASANGHFLVSYSDGEDRPSKRLKKSISMESSSRRSEKCPVEGCLKAFKQSAGLAYHIAHSDNHTNFITEEMMTTFSGTLVSKVRWWFKKKNIVIADN